MNIAFIPARCGSKGVPRKNIKLINGKPLIVWSIEQALSSEMIDDVYVSTDCEEIRLLAESHGAKAPFLRPESLSGDTASTESAVMHFIREYEAAGMTFDNLVLIQATSPFRYPGVIDKALCQFNSENADSMLTVTKTHKFIWNNKIAPKASYDIFARPRRQDISAEDQIYFENGSFYVTKKSIYEKYSNRLGGKISLFEMSPEESFEIDDEFDFKMIEMLMHEYGFKQ